jgi:hypothetical protein
VNSASPASTSRAGRGGVDRLVQRPEPFRATGAVGQRGDTLWCCRWIASAGPCRTSSRSSPSYARAPQHPHPCA